MEQWKDIEGYEGLYQVSNYGRIKRLPKTTISKNGTIRVYDEMIRKLSKGRDGYLHITLYSKDKIPKRYSVHRLVSLHFLPKVEGMEIVNHIDGNKTNNHISNLEWANHSTNGIHAFDKGLSPKGEKHGKAKLTTEEVNYIRENYKPYDKVFGAKPLAEKFNVHYKTIVRIAMNQVRKDG